MPGRRGRILLLAIALAAVVVGGLVVLRAAGGDARRAAVSPAAARRLTATSPGFEFTNGPPLPAGPRTGQQVRGPYRLLRAPVVVRWTSGKRGEQPTYEVYFRLNRPLPDVKYPLRVRVDGGTGFSPTGAGYESTSDHGNCYAHTIDDPFTFPPSLRHSRDGQRVRVTVSILARPRGFLSISVPLSPRNRVDPPPGDANGQRFSSLGCD